MGGLTDYEDKATGLAGAAMDASIDAAQNKRWLIDQLNLQKQCVGEQQPSMIVRLERIESAIKEIARVTGIKLKF